MSSHSLTTVPDAPARVPEAPEVDAPPKLSRVPRGYWRNEYEIDRLIRIENYGLVGPGKYLGPKKWPSREIAEQKGIEFERNPWVLKNSRDASNPRYLGPVFFPEDGDAAWASPVKPRPCRNRRAKAQSPRRKA